MAHIFHSSVNSFYSWQWLLFNWDRKCVIFQKDNKGFQTWTVTDAVWEESHLLLLSTILGLPLMTQWLGIHLNAGVTGNAGLIPELRRSSEEEMATHSRIIARVIPWTEKPGGLQSLGSQRVRQDCMTEHTCTAVPPARSSHGNSEKQRKVQCIRNLHPGTRCNYGKQKMDIMLRMKTNRK